MFDLPMLIPIIAIIACIFSIATSSISVKTFNDNNEYKETNKNSFNYVVFSLVVSIILLIVSIVYLGIVIQSKAQ